MVGNQKPYEAPCLAVTRLSITHLWDDSMVPDGRFMGEEDTFFEGGLEDT